MDVPSTDHHRPPPTPIPIFLILITCKIGVKDGSFRKPTMPNIDEMALCVSDMILLCHYPNRTLFANNSRQQ